MVANPKADLQDLKLGPGSTAIVVGGTTGIGAAVARKLASVGCSRIVILGRDEKRASEVIDKLRQLSQDEFEGRFVKGDISYVNGIKTAFNDLKTSLGTDKVDYVVMCQNGPPTGTINLNEDGEGKEFTIQALSRFLFTFLILQDNLLSPGAKVMFIANTGLSYPLDLDDLSLKNVAAKGRSKALLTIDQSKRDSTVLDSVVLQFNTRFPQYTFYHLHPGLVKTELFNIHNFPFPLSYIAGLGLMVMGSTPDEYANVPVYILAHPDAKEQLGEGKLWDHRLHSKSPGAWPSDGQNRIKLWNKLLQMSGEQQ
ncbi:uncharacterized protein I303_106908 [Kwoniella dejecticola CBS 10117]|uniref:Ketoreductase (KR) domain-containing protein n=1 Tax=Kwoniella dejecticola CBS 10117 TaxID=1296121 RepID=A0A1A5ZTD0_9TREE|nr:uncharacterized protein I303_08453 [Kwoniella dejecticola CBS 10117]OBR81071.1 hypothetical protein I303_08453 [Kwoniella dejecticola CBS 10117]